MNPGFRGARHQPGPTTFLARASLTILFGVAALLPACSDNGIVSDAQPTSTQSAPGDHSLGDHTLGDDTSAEDSPSAGSSLGIGPAELRSRWNAAIEDSSGEPGAFASHLQLGELDTEGSMMSGLLERGGTISGELDDGGALLTLSVRIEESDALLDARSRSAVPRLLLVSTLPSAPALGDETVEALARDLSVAGMTAGDPPRSAVSGGLQYTSSVHSNGWSISVRPHS